jgi:hypothetical protein
MNISCSSRDLLTVPVAARSETCACHLSPAEIVGSNPTGDRSQWPRSLRLGPAASSPAETVGLNLTGGMDACLL